MSKLKSNKKVVIFGLILVISIISLIGYKIYAANTTQGVINIKIAQGQGDVGILCTPATELETAVCRDSFNPGCLEDGYAKGETITYGSLVDGNTLEVGNALSCRTKSNPDSYQRFYYLTDLEENPDYAVLVGKPSISGYSYKDDSGEILRTIRQDLKNESQWPNFHLESLNEDGGRNIYDIDGNLVYENVIFKPLYNSNKNVERLMTYNELARACITDPTKPMEIDRKCNFIYGRNHNYTDAYQDYTHYWLETISSANVNNAALALEDNGKIVNYNITNSLGIVPVIEVDKKKIDLNPTEEISVTIKENSTINLDDYKPEWDNEKNNSYADFEGWQCKTNSGEYKNIGTSFSKSSYPECVDSNGNVELKPVWNEYHKIELSTYADPYESVGTIEGGKKFEFKIYKNQYVDLGSYNAERDNYKLWYYTIDRYYGKYNDQGSYERGTTDFKNFTSWTGYASTQVRGGYLTLYAYWDDDIYIWFSGTDYDGYYGRHETFEIPANVFTQGELNHYESQGQRLLHWKTTLNGADVSLKAGDVISIDEYAGSKKSIYIYPVWEYKKTITYDANGGTNAPANATFYSSDTVKISSTIPTKTGYTFKGWSYTQNGSVALNAGASVTGTTLDSYVTDKNVTLYAVWEPTKYTITFNANSGSVSPTSKSVTYDGTYGDLPTPTKTGHTFNGWYTNTSYTTQITATTKVNITTNQTLYAKWTANQYILTFNANGGSMVSTSKNPAYGETYGYLPTPERKGHTFAGWYTAASGGTKIESTTIFNSTSDQTLYAHWTPNKYQLTFDANGGSVSLTSKSVTYDGTYGDLPTPEKTGYEFTGWFTAKTGGTKIEATTKVTITSDQTLYARWNKIYNINFDANGGNDAPSAFKTTNTITIPSTIPNKEGFAFAGWELEKNGTAVYNVGDKISISNISSGLINGATITLYAKWSEVYTLSFDANGGKGAPASMELKNTKGTLPTIVPEKERYIFKGWAYENDANEEIYKSGGIYDVSKIPSNYITSKNIINLYAVWAKKYIINFDANGGSGAPSKIETLVTGSLPETIPTREGYNFKGWSLTNDGEVWRSSKGYYDLSSMDTEITLYAVWQKTSSNIGDTTITIVDEVIDDAIDDIVIEEIFEDNNDFVNIRNKVNNRLSSKVTKLKVYNIYLINDKKEKIQPSKSITLELSLSKDYTNNIAVYRMEDNNKLTKLDSSIENNKIKFSTDHFSYYSIVEVDSNENINELDKPENEDGIKVPDNTENNGNNDTNNNSNTNNNNESKEPENNSNNNENKDEFENPQTGISISIVTVIGLSVVALGIKRFVKKKEMFRNS